MSILSNVLFVVLDFLAFVGGGICLVLMGVSILPWLAGLVVLHYAKRGLSKVFNRESHFKFFDVKIGDGVKFKRGNKSCT